MKRLSKYLFLILVTLIPPGLYGQYKGFDLSRYKLPDIKINRLDANVNLSNDASSNSYEISNADSSEMKNNSFQGDLNLNYYHFRNTEKYQGDLQITLFGNTNPYKYRDDAVYSTRNIQNENLSVSSTNRFYNQKLNFIEADPQASVNKSVNKSYYEDMGNYSRKECDDQYTTNISIPVSVGHGRIEPVEDLRLAIYILEELNKAGRIDSLPSDEVVLDMARQISAIKRKRFFDTRLKKIRELQVIDSFLIANRVIKPADITYFAVLNDQWDYASGPPRSTGFAVNAGIDNGFHSGYASLATSIDAAEPDKSISTQNIWEIGGFFQARYYKPVNLYWQTSVIFLVSYEREFARDPRDEDNPFRNYETNVLNTSLGYSLQFLPNSRTSVELTFSGNYWNSSGTRTISTPLPSQYQMKDNTFTLLAGLGMYYYISPQFRIQLNSSLSYYTRNDVNSRSTQPDIRYLMNSFHNNFALTLIYSFF